MSKEGRIYLVETTEGHGGMVRVIVLAESPSDALASALLHRNGDPRHQKGSITGVVVLGSASIPWTEYEDKDGDMILDMPKEWAVTVETKLPIGVVPWT